MTEEKWRNAIKEEEVTLCSEWLSLQDKIKTPNKKFTSYGLKHIIENYYKTYISEASLVEAVKRLNFPHIDIDPYSMIREKDGTISRRQWGVYLCISRKTIRYYSDKERNAI